MTTVEREISPNTHYKIIVGIFESTEKAHKAKESYIKYCENYDKWAEKAYRTAVLN